MKISVIAFLSGLTLSFASQFVYAGGGTKAKSPCERVLTIFGEPLESLLQPDSPFGGKVETLNASVAEAVDAKLLKDFADIIARFQRYDLSLRAAVIEADYLIDAGLLSMLGRGHFLIVGGGGNAKSMLVQKMLDNVLFEVDEDEISNGVPLRTRKNREGRLVSLIKRQMTSTTTFGDVFGQMNTHRQFLGDGQFERHLHQGVMAFAFVFFDEFPDADARLLRALLNLLNERELSEAGETFYAQLRSVFATSNYYLPEIYLSAARKAIKLEMLIDRFRYVAMVPKTFAHEGAIIAGAERPDSNSYQKMFGVVLDGDGADISPLPMKDLVQLQTLAKRVKVPEVIREYWERVAKRVDRRLKIEEQTALEEYSRLIRDGETPPPPYRVTKPMTKRTMGAGAAELRNLVVLDWIRRGGNRPLVANFTDVYRLQYFSGLVGPNQSDLAKLIANSGHDLNELAMLNTVDLERKAFIETWQEVVDEILTEISRLK